LMFVIEFFLFSFLVLLAVDAVQIRRNTDLIFNRAFLQIKQNASSAGNGPLKGASIPPPPPSETAATSSIPPPPPEQSDPSTTPQSQSPLDDSTSSHHKGVMKETKRMMRQIERLADSIEILTFEIAEIQNAIDARDARHYRFPPTLGRLLPIEEFGRDEPLAYPPPPPFRLHLPGHGDEIHHELREEIDRERHLKRRQVHELEKLQREAEELEQLLGAQEVAKEYEKRILKEEAELEARKAKKKLEETLQAEQLKQAVTNILKDREEREWKREHLNLPPIFPFPVPFQQTPHVNEVPLFPIPQLEAEHAPLENLPLKFLIHERQPLPPLQIFPVPLFTPETSPQPVEYIEPHYRSNALARFVQIDDETAEYNRTRPTYVEKPVVSENNEDNNYDSVEEFEDSETSENSEPAPVIMNSLEKTSKYSVPPIYDRETNTRTISSKSFPSASISSRYTNLETSEPQYVDSLTNKKIEERSNEEKNIIEIKQDVTYVDEPSSGAMNKMSNSHPKIVENDSIIPEMSVIEIASNKEQIKNKKNQRNEMITPVYTENHTPKFVQDMEMEDNIVKPFEMNQMENLSIEQQQVNVPDWAVNNFVAPDFME